jgi:hypothetical protein
MWYYIPLSHRQVITFSVVYNLQYPYCCCLHFPSILTPNTASSTPYRNVWTVTHVVRIAMFCISGVFYVRLLWDVKSSKYLASKNNVMTLKFFSVLPFLIYSSLIAENCNSKQKYYSNVKLILLEIIETRNQPNWMKNFPFIFQSSLIVKL